MNKLERNILKEKKYRQRRKKYRLPDENKWYALKSHGKPCSIARQLIDTGANVNAIDKNGYTPLDATTYEQFSESKTRLAIAELLRESGGELKQSVQE